MENNKQLLEGAKKYLASKGSFDKNENETVKRLVSVLDEEVPYKMAVTIANFTMLSLVGHFHAKLLLSETNTPPINMIGFILAKSGAKKTSSVLKMEKAIQPGLEVVEHIRKKREEERAKVEDIPPRTLNPLSNALSTVPGLLSNLNSFKDEGIGLPTMVVDEVATAIAVNPDFIPNVEVISQLFDDGDCKVKIVKDQELQSEPVYGMGMNGLFIGSEKGILEDKAILKKFMLEFISKLSRRCFFVYPVFEETDSDTNEILEFVSKKKNNKEEQQKNMQEIGILAGQLAGRLLKEEKVHIEINDEAMEMWNVYEAYCSFRSKKFSRPKGKEDDENEVRELEQEHRHWKMIKLAGAYAIWNGSDKITKKEINEAIYIAELTGDDLNKFMAMAEQVPHEKLVYHFLEGGGELTLHQLVKKDWIRNERAMKEMVDLANSQLQGKGQIQNINNTLSYQKYRFVDKDDDLPISFKLLPPLNTEEYIEKGLSEYDALQAAKQERSFSIVDGYTVKTTKWSKLPNLLRTNCVFNPYQFMTLEEGAITTMKDPKGGIRGRDNLKSHSSFIILDVDDSEITIEEAADALQDYRYHMARTSNKDNPYKYRVLLQSDIEINVNGAIYKKLIKAISRELALFVPDDLAQSQGIFGYDDREVISNEGDLLPVSQILPTISTDTQKAIKKTPAERDETWENRETEFSYAYTCTVGYHNALFRAMMQARDWGYSYEQNEALIDDINEKNPNRTMRANFERSLEQQRKEAYGRLD